MTTDTRTTPSPASERDQARWIDRLVDGELDEAERHRLLASLDADPAGWKRCSLAFLEAQAWRQAIRCATNRPQGDAAVSAARLVRGKNRRTPTRVLGLAAAILLAFGVGFTTRPANPPGGGRPNDVTLSAGHDDRPSAERAPLPPRPDGWLAASDGGGRPLPVPLFAAAGGADSPALHTQPAIPDYLRQQLRREGYEVRNDRKLVSVALKDGRTATVPVETVQYRYVGQSVY